MPSSFSKKDKKHVSYYDTQYGTFTMKVTARSVLINVDDSGGEIKVDYKLEIDDNKSGEMIFICLLER